jgi:hypothetical protein
VDDAAGVAGVEGVTGMDEIFVTGDCKREDCRVGVRSVKGLCGVDWAVALEFVGMFCVLGMTKRDCGTTRGEI